VSKAKCMILNGSDDFYDLYGDSKTRGNSRLCLSLGVAEAPRVIIEPDNKRNPSDDLPVAPLACSLPFKFNFASAERVNISLGVEHLRMKGYRVALPVYLRDWEMPVARYIYMQFFGLFPVSFAVRTATLHRNHLKGSGAKKHYISS